MTASFKAKIRPTVSSVDRNEPPATEIIRRLHLPLNHHAFLSRTIGQQFLSNDSFPE
ncbi:hypothetical protein HPP92_005080 [Vanilla planifolia]|uniref:Uncharacterized protein n=1 Tax=Vanilla planifolia TaxID=51239 RepID=A0A835RSR9_VANPL|nr:hypothetical protein HPP92_005080 [Vanilla planifolia]